MDVVVQYWPILAVAGSVAFGYVAFQSATKHRLENIERRVGKVEDAIEALEKSRTVDAVTLGIIQTTLTQIKESIDGLRDEMRTKADK